MCLRKMRTLKFKEKEIINFETSDNPEFKNIKNKLRKRKKKKSKSRAKKALKTQTLNNKKKEIDEILGPLGNGEMAAEKIGLLDFTDMKNIPEDKKKELKITKADEEYFSGAKKNLFGKKSFKHHLPSKYETEKPKLDDNPLSKKIEEFFGLREKRQQRIDQKQRFIEEKKKQDEAKIAKMLEQNIIDDIGVNFLFKRGTGLKEGLIDIDRAYKIIEKIDNTFKESQLNVNQKKDKSINIEDEEEKMYNFDFYKFFEKADLDAISESQKSFITTSSVPKKADCFLEEEKWAKVMKFLRANPNLLLKLVPTTMAVDEQGVEELQRLNKNMNIDLDMTQKPVRVKSAGRKKRPISKKQTLKEDQINKSQILAFSNYPDKSKRATVMDTSFYSDSRSIINKSNMNISILGSNDGRLNDKRRMLNLAKLSEQIPGTNLPSYILKTSALSKADSVYSSSNVPVIKDLKSRMRPMSMKHPRKMRQKIDEKFLKNPDLHNENIMAMPTIWNPKNPNNHIQIPFHNAPFEDPSMMSYTQLKRPDFTQSRFENETNGYKERMGIGSPNAVLDLTKPVLSLRNQVKNDVIQQEFLYRAKLLNKNKNKRGSTLINPGPKSVVSAPAQRKRVKTREDTRPKLNNKENSSSPKRQKRGKHSKSPSMPQADSKERNIRIRKKKKSKAENRIEELAQAGDRDESPEKSEGKKSIRRSKEKRSVISNQSYNFSQRPHIKGHGLSPPNIAYIQVSEGQEPLETYSANTPMTYDVGGGMFGMNLNDESAIDPQEFGINIRSNITNFEDTAKKSHKVEIIDWADSQIFQMVLDGDIELNKEKNNMYFRFEEVDYIVHMMKKRYRDFKTASALMPFFRKGKNTLEMLMNSLEIGHVYAKVDFNYQEITLEN